MSGQFTFETHTSSIVSIFREFVAVKFDMEEMNLTGFEILNAMSDTTVATDGSEAKEKIIKEVRFCEDVEVHYVPIRTFWQRAKTNIKYSPQHIKHKAKLMKNSVSESYYVFKELLT